MLIWFETRLKLVFTYVFQMYNFIILGGRLIFKEVTQMADILSTSTGSHLFEVLHFLTLTNEFSRITGSSTEFQPQT